VGVAIGLAVGEVVRVSAGIAVMVRTGWGHLQEGVGWRHAFGVAALAGIEFTVSLVIAELAHTDALLIETAEIGIFAGSLGAGPLGAAVFASAVGLSTRRTPMIQDPVGPAMRRWTPRLPVVADGVRPVVRGGTVGA
jgi:Na+/H+ antiporter NhaA